MKKHCLYILVIMPFLFCSIACSNSDDEMNPRVVIREDGTASNGSRFVAVNNTTFYLDYVRYSVKSGHLIVSGYDKEGFNGKAKIAANIVFNGSSYEVLGIKENAFRDCADLTMVVIPNSVTEIGYAAFDGCVGLKSAVISNKVSSIGIDAFRGCRGLTSLKIPDGVTTISHSSFAGCSGLTSLTIPNSVTAIDERAFSGCSGLTSLKIPDHVGRIEDNAFSGCSGLTSLTIPSSVRVIGNYAFSGCIGLKDVYCHIVDLSNLYIGGALFVGGYIFEHADVSKATLHVPASAIADYKRNDHWKEFGSIVAL